MFTNLKKCPGCGSLEADEDTICGVCGYDIRNIPPMEESIDQRIEEDSIEKAAAYVRIEKQDLKNLRKESLFGLGVGVITLVLGVWLFFSTLSNLPTNSNLANLGIPIGTLLMAFGTVTVETVFNLYEGAPYHNFAWCEFIARKYDRDTEAREKRAQSD